MTPPTAHLARLQLIQEYKRKMPRPAADANVGPFDDRIRTDAAGAGGDLADIHAEVRGRIREAIAGVRDRGKSQVVLLAGGAGSGKTHLLQSFDTPEAVADLGHVFIGGSNEWHIDEFPAQLLDWVISALTAPSPAADEHPLLDRVRAIGFRAVEHLLANPVTWKTCRARPRGRLRRLLGRWSRPSHAALAALTAARDPRVFRHLDQAAFGKYVCDRFLADRANLHHRYALRVLLLYLFPDRPDTGVGTRERVLHWFRDRGDDAYFARRLGARERPDRAFTQFEAVKLLAHIFSGEVSNQLSTAAHACPPRVFLLTFDQSEGRDELFDSDAGWMTFFAHLGELYHALPNVAVVFTMTLGLRNRLQNTMERQFRDRINMDDRYTLFNPTAAQSLAVYTDRVRRWLGDGPGVADLYARAGDPYAPFTAEEFGPMVTNATVRVVLERFGSAFHERLGITTVDPELDYLYDRNERRFREAGETEWDYTRDHIDTIGEVLRGFGASLAAADGLTVGEVSPLQIDNIPTLRIVFTAAGRPTPVVVHLARVGWTYMAQVGVLMSVLQNRPKDRHFLWVVRPQPLPEPLDAVPEHYQKQFTGDVCPSATESAFASLLRIHANDYPEADRAARDALTRREVDATYLGRLFAFAQSKLAALPANAPPLVEEAAL